MKGTFILAAALVGILWTAPADSQGRGMGCGRGPGWGRARLAPQTAEQRAVGDRIANMQAETRSLCAEVASLRLRGAPADQVAATERGWNAARARLAETIRANLGTLQEMGFRPGMGMCDGTGPRGRGWGPRNGTGPNPNCPLKQQP